MTNSNIILSIVIPVFNGLNFTKNCLSNIYDQINNNDIPNYKIETILIDDGSTDNTTNWVKENYPAVHVLVGDGSLWWSGGINKGIKFALDQIKTDYVLWWNNDILAQNDYFFVLYSIIQQNLDHNLIGSKIYILNKGLIFGIGGKFDPKNGDKYMFGENSKDEEEFQKPISSDWLPGMGTTIHKNVFEQIGLVDAKNFPQYQGDSDFTYRAKKTGFNLVAYPNLIICNDTTNSGLKHNDNLKLFIRSLSEIKSFYNFKIDLKFLWRHSESFFAYQVFFKKYLIYIGGFIKWKFLSLLKIYRIVNIMILFF